MQETTTKEKILKRIRHALISKKENPFSAVDFKSSVYQDFEEEEPVVQFALKLNQAGGNFIYCENEKAVAENMHLLVEQQKWSRLFTLDESVLSLLQDGRFELESSPERFNNLQVGISRCDFLIARFGSVMVSSALATGRRLFVYPEVHVVIARASQVVSELKEALSGIKKKYSGNLPSQITVITGPSRTADIEKTLVMGAHGPKELFVLLVDDL
ncbi:MAG: LUD domain-containing protein [Bacteroidales bacterium]|nr:LUD domain-containing protein [Bacteroidales bacterium]MCF6342380.1 LUD domain-containing protein [Bacteroidales bacterium]